MNGIQLPHGNVKRKHEVSQMSKTSASNKPIADEANGACSAWKGEKLKKRRRASEYKVYDSGIENTDPLLRGNGFQSGIPETEKATTVGTRLPASSRELSLLETRNMLMVKAKNEICKQMNKWRNTDSKLAALRKFTYSKVKEKTKEEISTLKAQSNAEINGRKQGSYAGFKHPECDLKTSSPSSKNDTDATHNVPLSITVPDPDFHDFDKKRTENSFGDSQVWAAYDDDDGMPRYYAMIHTVISRKPFKMRISWLNSKTTSEFGTINWVGCGFYKTSGDFRVGRYEINKSVNSFSHRVKWAKGTRGVIQIYPSKGDVWALYRNWSPEWNEHTPDEVIHQYEMVEVLEDYNEEKGATVIPLVKVAGFKTVFRQHFDKEHIKIIPRGEMFRFSHQVPSFLLTGQESRTAPKGCWELDPAATPLELLQVMTEATEELKKENTWKVARNGISDLKEAKSNDPVISEMRKLGDEVTVQVGATIG